MSSETKKQIEKLQLNLIELQKTYTIHLCNQTNLHDKEFHDLWDYGVEITTLLSHQIERIETKINELKETINENPLN